MYGSQNESRLKFLPEEEVKEYSERYEEHSENNYAEEKYSYQEVREHSSKYEECSSRYEECSEEYVERSPRRDREEKVRAHRTFLRNSFGKIISFAFIAVMFVAFSGTTPTTLNSDAERVFKSVVGSVTDSKTITVKNHTTDSIPNSDLSAKIMKTGKSKDSEETEESEGTIIITKKKLLFLTASNEYGTFLAPYPWMTDVFGTQLVEPYKNTVLTLSGSVYDSGLYHFEWEISDVGEVESGTEQTVVFTDILIHDITVKAYLIDGSSGVAAYSYTTRLVSKYVKRELRTLTIADREKFLDAAAVMWKYTQEEGEKKYGDKFTSINKFVAIHALASNDIMCDGFHEGSGFITHHLALTNSFEASLRAVDPSVTLPYWDFTIEGQGIKDAGQLPSYMLEITPIFSDTWFGVVDENHHIVNSRWAHSLMPKQPNSTVGVQNSYGYIRSYWNNNPDPEVSRMLFSTCGVEPLMKTIPNCADHLAVLNSATLGDFQLDSAGDGHGPLHVQIGGVWGGCTDAYRTFSEKWKDLLDANVTEQFILENNKGPPWRLGFEGVRRLLFEEQIMGESFHIYRSFWRSHMCALDGSFSLLECPKQCSQDTPFEECTCSVEKLKKNETTWENLFPCILNREENRDLFSWLFPEEMLRDMVTMMANTNIMEGEMIESASTADITFWLIHPSIERLLAAKRLTGLSTMSGSSFSKWGEGDSDWLDYSFYSFEKGANPHFSSEYRCGGHGAEDPVLPQDMPFTSAFDNSDTDGDTVLSNWEFYQALDPNNIEGNDYVFDHFDWDHCSAKNHGFGRL